MHKLYKNRKKPLAGSKLWRNPTERLLKIVVHQGTERTVQEVEPGGTISLPAGWSVKTVKTVCRVLVAADGDAPDPTPRPAPIAAPEEAAAPLGDPTKVQSEDDRKEGKEATHGSGDALEAYAQTLMRKSKAALVEMARPLGIDPEASKATLARAIALKSVEGDDDEPEVTVD